MYIAISTCAISACLYLMRQIYTIAFSYAIMRKCWKENPDERPSFSDLKMELGTVLSYATEEYGYLDFIRPSVDQCYKRISTDNGNTELPERHSGEPTASHDAHRNFVIDAAIGASHENGMKDSALSMSLRETDPICP